MTLEQITDKEFVRGLKFNTTCGKNDPEGNELYGHLRDYAEKHQNIHCVGKKNPSEFIEKDHPDIKKYKQLGMSGQNLGNCICRSPIAMINAIMRQMGKNSERIFLMLALKEWEKLHDNDEKPSTDQLSDLYTAYLQEIQQQVKSLAKVEGHAENDILSAYFTPRQKMLYAKALNF